MESPSQLKTYRRKSPQKANWTKAAPHYFRTAAGYNLKHFKAHFAARSNVSSKKTLPKKNKTDSGFHCTSPFIVLFNESFLSSKQKSCPKPQGSFFIMFMLMSKNSSALPLLVLMLIFIYR